MGCCALGTCTDPHCYLCTVVATWDSRGVARETNRRQQNPTRDGVAKTKRRDPVFTKRHRKPLTR